MKKSISMIAAAILVIAMVLSFASCGQSEAAKAADALIAAIGEVGLGSGDAITAAESAVAALEQKDKDSLKNLEILTQARQAYEDAVDLDKISTVEDLITGIGTVTTESEEAITAAREAYDNLEKRLQDRVSNADIIPTAEAEYIDAVLTAEAAIIEEAISDIGTVTLNSKGKIDSAKKRYDEASAEVKAKVRNAGDINVALDAYEGLRAAEVDALIDAIGEVSLESGDAIAAARAGLNDLSYEAVGKLKNKDILTSAEDTFKTLKQEEAMKLLQGFKVEEDKINNVKFYEHKTIPTYTNTRNYVLPYIGIRGNQVWLRFLLDYTGSSWVFFEKVIFSVDGKNTTKYFSYYDVTRDSRGYGVSEHVDVSDVSYIGLFEAIASSETTIVRFQGDDYRSDFEVSKADKDAIRETLDAYYALVAAGFSDITG